MIKETAAQSVLYRKKSSIKDSPGDKFLHILINFFLFIFGAACLYPMIFVFSASVSDPTAVNSGQIWLLPKGFSIQGYTNVMKNQWVLIGYRNSLLYALLGTLINLLVTFMAAYALSRKDMYGHGIITFFMVFTMWFGGGLIPTFIQVNSYGLVNSPYVMLILGAISMYNCIICRSFIQGIPFELQEAARIDGCSDFGILWKIVFPLSGPVLAILALYYGLGHWNGYFNALIYLNNRSFMPLQIFLREILVENQSFSLESADLEAVMLRVRQAQVMKYSLIVIASLPMLIIYPFVQKFFVKGVMIGSVKG